MRETAVEQHCTKRAKQMGGLAVKHVSPGRAGDPDRLIALPMAPCPHCGSAARVGLLELKRPREGVEPGSRQDERLKEWRRLGVPASWAATHTRVDAFLELLAAGRALGGSSALRTMGLDGAEGAPVLYAWGRA